jgi:hypothetical protein
MLPVATVRTRGPAAGLRRAALELRAAARAVEQRPGLFLLAWTGSVGAVQAAALYLGLIAQDRPRPDLGAVALAALGLAVIAGLCVGVYLFVRMLGAGGRVAAGLVAATFYGFCAAGSSEPGLLPAIAMWPAGVVFAMLLPCGPWSPPGPARTYPGR